MRVVITKDITMPDKAVMLPAKHADRTQMNELVDIDSDAIHLFDRGYNDYKQFDELCWKNVRFITRIKKNAKIEVVSEQEPDTEHNIFLDQKVYLDNAQNRTKMDYPLRLIKTKDSEGNVVIIITNCFDLTAKEIGDLYRYRWKIETFFKWVKQHLKVKTFYGKSENAVYTQIWIALITYCLQVLLQLKFNHEGSVLEIKRTLKTLLFQPLDEFLRSFFRKPTRTSKGRQNYN
ncbi:IS4 family transposase [Lentibacillus salinarum]|uniref:IS4 family transposase n=1 Tax=Lentibacillus salinarum TaxID=446820 RepID=A0ABW3ZV57_9BACI